jgi:hypothetical protein
VFFAALTALPFVFTTPWVQDLFFFTLMYAALASAWNIVGGYSGYISLGHAAFFGIGAYAIGIIFTHISIGDGYRPFYVLPLVGIGVAIVSVPMGWIAYRTPRSRSSQSRCSFSGNSSRSTSDPSPVDHRASRSRPRTSQSRRTTSLSTSPCSRYSHCRCS